MKTIQQNVAVNFNAIEVKDAVKAIIIMDALKSHVETWERYNTYNSLNEEEKRNTERVYKPRELTITISEEQAKSLFELFENLGFCTSY